MHPERGGRGEQVRHKVFAAMQRVIARQGVPHLTLEAVAAEAGISKGGLLYHFPSKDSLWQGLLEDFHTNFARNCWNEFQNDPEPNRAGRIHRAWIRSTKTDPMREFNADISDVLAIVSNVQFCRPMQSFWGEWEKILAQDGIPCEDSLIISLTIGGMKMHRIVNHPLSDEMRDQLFMRLLELASGKETRDYETIPGQWERTALDAWKGEG